MSPALLLAGYCSLIIAASIGGGLVPLLVRPTHTRLQVGISFTAGFMLGIALLHMIPHAAMELGTGSGMTAAMVAVLVGFLCMFFIERFFSFHTHEVAEIDEHGQVTTSPEHLHDHDPADHAHHHDHVHAHGMVGHTAGNKLHWTGAAVGLTLHSVLGGIALASAVAAESSAGLAATALAGMAVFLVIVLHKPLDALTIITLTATAGHSRAKRHAINAAFSLAVPLGVVLFWISRGQIGGEGSNFASLTLAFSAGTFLCIALSDLLPELQFHAHDRGKLSAALLIGVGLAFAVAGAESSMHDHAGLDHGHGEHAEHDGHEGHAEHDHGHSDHLDHGDHEDHAEPVTRAELTEDHDPADHAPAGEGAGDASHDGHDHGEHMH